LTSPPHSVGVGGEKKRSGAARAQRVRAAWGGGRTVPPQATPTHSAGLEGGAPQQCPGTGSYSGGGVATEGAGGAGRGRRTELGGSLSGANAMFLTVAALAKSKSKFVLVRMVSAAGTGFCCNIKKLRQQEKLVLLKYDPIVNKRVLFTEKRKIRSI
uniref:Large ribosomal subunit protein bL33m n=1 Tax=Pelusios castaneus TaxID=367368 RepID=A0A8C8REK6_9SAUR